jgi:hypothetical protein
MHTDIHVMLLLLLTDFNENQNIPASFSKTPIYHENLFQ